MIPLPRWWARERSRRRSLRRRRRCLSFLPFFSSVVWSSRLPFSRAFFSREICCFVSLLTNDVDDDTHATKRDASKSSSLLLLSRKSRVSFEGGKTVVARSRCRRLEKVPALLFETLVWTKKGFFFTKRFCREVLCPLYLRVVSKKKNASKKIVSKKMSRVFPSIFTHFIICLKNPAFHCVHGSSSR